MLVITTGNDVGILSFIADMTKAAAWPLTALIIATFFRRELRGVINRLRRGKFGGTEFELFEQELRVAEAIVNSPRRPDGPAPDLRFKIATPTVNLETDDPALAIIHAWSVVENEAAKLVTVGHPEAEKPGTLAMRIAISSDPLLGSDDEAIFLRLLKLRNNAIHLSSFEPSSDVAKRYSTLALTLTHRIRDAIAMKSKRP